MNVASLMIALCALQNPPPPPLPIPAAPAAIPGVTVVLTIDQPSIPLGETVQAEVRVKNTGDKPATIPQLVFDERSLSFEVAIELAAGARKTFDHSVLQGHPLAKARAGIPDVVLAKDKEMVGYFAIPALSVGKMDVTAKFHRGEEVASSQTVTVNVKDVGGKSKLTAVFDTTAGPIRVRLYPDVSPRNVANFVMLAKSKFYDGLEFYSVVRSKWAHSGCPFNKGTGNPGYAVRAEPTEAKTGNPVHDKGTLSLGGFVDRREYTSSQFFFSLSAIPSFDGTYTIIGKVESADPKTDPSLKTLDKISDGGADGATMKPKTVTINSVRIEAE